MKKFITTITFICTLAISTYGNSSPAEIRFNSFNNFVKNISSKNEAQKVIEVNRFFNHYRYASDKHTYNKVDYWASRNEFIKRGIGDCEDFAIAKYFTLLDLGVPAHKLSLVVTKLRGTNHLVLAYSTNKKVYFLDNVTNKISSNRNDLTIQFTVSKEPSGSMSQEIASYHFNRVVKMHNKTT